MPPCRQGPAGHPWAPGGEREPVCAAGKRRRGTAASPTRWAPGERGFSRLAVGLRGRPYQALSNPPGLLRLQQLPELPPLQELGSSKEGFPRGLQSTGDGEMAPPPRGQDLAVPGQSESGGLARVGGPPPGLRHLQHAGKPTGALGHRSLWLRTAAKLCCVRQGRGRKSPCPPSQLLPALRPQAGRGSEPSPGTLQVGPRLRHIPSAWKCPPELRCSPCRAGGRTGASGSSAPPSSPALRGCRLRQPPHLCGGGRSARARSWTPRRREGGGEDLSPGSSKPMVRARRRTLRQEKNTCGEGRTGPGPRTRAPLPCRHANRASALPPPYIFEERQEHREQLQRDGDSRLPVHQAERVPEDSQGCRPDAAVVVLQSLHDLWQQALQSHRLRQTGNLIL